MKQYPITHTEAEWRKILTPEQYGIMREHGTETPGSCALLNEKRAGTFHCAACDQPLFRLQAQVRERHRLAEFQRSDPWRRRIRHRHQSRHDAR